MTVLMMNIQNTFHEFQYNDLTEIDIVLSGSDKRSTITIPSRINLTTHCLLTNGIDKWFLFLKAKNRIKGDGVSIGINLSSLTSIAKTYPNKVIDANFSEDINNLLNKSPDCKEVWRGRRNDAYRS